MRVFSKYSPKEVSEILLYNDEKQILVTEWLDSYRPLSRYFEFSPALVAANAQSGVSFRHVTLPVLEVDSDTCRAMGTIMGRSHARTCRL